MFLWATLEYCLEAKAYGTSEGPLTVPLDSARLEETEGDGRRDGVKLWETWQRLCTPQLPVGRKDTERKEGQECRGGTGRLRGGASKAGQAR